MWSRFRLNDEPDQGCLERCSKAEEYFSAIEEVNQPKDEDQNDNGKREVVVVAEQVFNVATDKAFAVAAEVDNICHQIDGDGIHAQPDEGLSPFLEFPDFDDLIEEAEEDGAATAGNQNIGGGPKEFDNGKLE